jgi:ureidoglycolate amidohydrolase
MNFTVDQDRLNRELETLGSISSEPTPIVTRVVFSEADLRGRNFVKSLCREAGLDVHEDAVGNTFAHWTGSDPALPPVATGSHMDALPNGGRYDGTVGVLGGLEAIRTLRRAGFQPRRSIELLIFTSEEPTRFGIGCLGSRFLVGTLDASADQSLKDKDGKSLEEIRTAAGFTGSLSSVRLSEGCYSAFVELHIEQGPLLEQHDTALGVVTAIAAPASLRVSIEGEGGHAGAVLMHERRDAFLAAAEIALAMEAAARSTGARDTVGTVGLCNIFPGACNSIPSRVLMEIDVRDIDQKRRDGVLEEISKKASEAAKRRRVEINVETLNADPPAQCDPHIQDAIIHGCQKHGLTFERMISRAYHDSLFLARVAPTGMLFIPCRGGVSHRPDEYSSPEGMARGTLVLAETLAELSAE